MSLSADSTLGKTAIMLFTDACENAHAACPMWPDCSACCQVSNTKDNAPCSTLFVGNLGDTVSEPELMALFSAQPGFVTLKVVRNARNATAFVDFSDLAAAMAVHDSQQVQRFFYTKEWRPTG